MLKLKRTFSLFVVCLSLLACTFVPAVVYAANGNTTQAIVQSYGTDTTIRQGMIVELKKGDTSKVEPLTNTDVTGMQGVAISASDALITLSGNAASTSQIYVATSGRYNVLVSNQNGAIHAGDYISISALDGIGMKAEDTEQTVLGKAGADFTGKGSGVAGTATLKNSFGGTITVTLGSIPVDINIANNPAQGHGIGELPGFLQVASNSIADKPVGAARIYISLAVLFITVLIVGSLLYSGVRNSIVSIGRNPLAKGYIVRGLTQVVLTSIIIFILGLFAVYLLLRL